MIVDDNKYERELLSSVVRRMELEILTAADGAECIAALKEAPNIKVITLDLNMPEMKGLEVLEIITKHYPNIPVIVITGRHSQEDAVNAMKAGAVDFFSKPIKPERIIASVQNALRMYRLKTEVERLKSSTKGYYKFTDLIGYDGDLSNSIALAKKAAVSDAPVLITGETGAGKEVFARAIHEESPRADQPFIAVNCGAIPKELVESTLFGHEKGSFTGAIAKSLGKFREANGGSLFLDEIGDLPLDAQVKILRAIQEQEIQPVGLDSAMLVDVRIIAATNRDLKMAVKNGHFREDLYFRLNVLNIPVPPLRDRANDIQTFANAFLLRHAQTTGTPRKTLSADLTQALQNYQWPGNVRELENKIQRALILSDHTVLTVSDFEFANTASDNDTEIKRNAMISILDKDGALKTLAEIEQDFLELALDHCNHNFSKTARAIKIAKSTLYRKVNENL